MDKNTNFSISGGACAPSYTCSIPGYDPITLDKGIVLKGPPFKVSLDKEWVKRLLWEFHKHNLPANIGMGRIDLFLDESEVWNGKGLI
jgi:hypothetical protein